LESTRETEFEERCDFQTEFGKQTEVQPTRQSGIIEPESVDFPMRYLVKARVRSSRKDALAKAIAEGTLGRGSIAGDEYLHNMETARVDAKGEAHWVETCFCDPPLAEERPYWEEYFDLRSVKDAHSRRNCRHENGTEPWACCDCDCTKRLEEKLARAGTSFLSELGSSSTACF